MKRHVLAAGAVLASALALWVGSAYGADDKPADDGGEAQDVVYLGAGRPALLRLDIAVGGKPLLKKYETFMASYFEFLDRNKSGGLDRVECNASPSPAMMLQFLQGNPFVQTARTGLSDVRFEAMDADRDGKVTADEFVAFYKANGAGPVVIGQATAFASTSGTDPVFDLLDADGDGRISPAELAAAEKSLMRLDNDDDELLTLAEAGGSASADPRFRRSAMLQRTALRSEGPTTLLLVPSADKGKGASRMKVARDLLARLDKDKDGSLSFEESKFPKPVFDKLDRNGDGKLSGLELARLSGGEPEATFRVALADGVGGRMGMMRRDDKGATVRSVTIDNVKLSVVPDAMVRDTTSGFRNFLTNQFTNADKDSRGFVTRRQLDPQQHFYLNTMFPLADRNGDSRLTREELKEWYDMVSTGWNCSVTVSLASTGAGMFQALDANSDGKLSVREVRSAGLVLAEFDKDKDGSVSREEFPQQFRLSVGAGVATQGFDGGMGMAPTRPVASTRGPVWFRKMDRNGDGDVSRREWLGTAEDFAKIDADNDGIVSPEEAIAFDEKVRGK